MRNRPPPVDFMPARRILLNDIRSSKCWSAWGRSGAGRSRTPREKTGLLFAFRWIVAVVIHRRRHWHPEDEIVDVIRGRFHAITDTSGAETARVIRWRNTRELRFARALIEEVGRLLELSGRT